MKISAGLYDAKCVVIRCDASPEIGMGHIMRDIVLAKKFKGAKIIFAYKYFTDKVIKKIKQMGFYSVHLQSGTEKEMIALIKKIKADTLVIDNYQITADYENNIKKELNIRIIVIDDMRKEHRCDVLINPNIHSNNNQYLNLVPKHCTLLCGKKHMLIKEDFYLYKNKKKPINKVPVIFVGIGGTDTKNLIIRTLEALDEIKKKEVVVATTSANLSLQTLKMYARNRKWITLHIDTENIAELMYKSNIAIVSPSSFANEALFLNLPIIAIKTADNQKFMFEYIKQLNYPTFEKFDKTNLIKSINYLIEKQRRKGC